jgi:hypothetical protein
LEQAAREALEKKVAELTAELEAATAPAADGDATPPAKGKPKTS